MNESKLSKAVEEQHTTSNKSLAYINKLNVIIRNTNKQT